MMIKKETAAKICTIILIMAGLTDLIRGFAHTFNVRYSAQHLAGIEPISDSLVLMSAFGMSNFLTAFIYFLIVWKARPLAPFILILIPLSYFIGGLGMKFQNVQLESQFQGQYMMSFYLGICFISGLLFFLSKKSLSPHSVSK
jgi:uncharacterized membrane protein